ncbi:MAG: WD40 repeat domain-containing protein [Gemmataceae bacterium]|nr:WD40 repeat domain-containing protein [Gemmataceae bacterium]
MDREQQLDEVITAYLKAVEAGERIDQGEWLKRYPDLADALAEFFVSQQSVERVAAPLRDVLPSPNAPLPPLPKGGTEGGSLPSSSQLGKPALAAVIVAALLSLLGGGAYFTAQLAKQRAEEANKARKDADLEKTKAQAERDRANSVRHAIHIHLGLRAWEQHDVALAERILGEIDEPFRNSWEVRHLLSLCRRKALTFRGHTDRVSSVAISADGRRIVSGSSDGTVRVWDAATGKEQFTLKGHQGYVTSVALSADGRRLGSAAGALNGPGEVKVWDADSGEENLTLKNPFYRVYAVALSGDGRRIAAGGRLRDKTGLVLVWDAATGEEKLTLKGRPGGDWADVASVAFSPDGQRLAAGSYGAAMVWDTVTGQEQLTLKCDTNRVSSVAFSADGRRIVSGTGNRDNPGKAGVITVWDAATGKEQLTVKGSTGPVLSVAFSADGRHIVSGGSIFRQAGEVKLWDAATGQERLTLKGHTGPVFSVALSADGRRIVSGGGAPARPGEKPGEVRLWDVAAGQEKLTLDGFKFGGAAFSADGQRVARADPGNVVSVFRHRHGTASAHPQGAEECLRRLRCDVQRRWPAHRRRELGRDSHGVGCGHRAGEAQPRGPRELYSECGVQWRRSAPRLGRR